MNPHFESRSLDDLVPDFSALVKEVIQRCAVRKVVMVPFFTLRGPGVQARLWCQSRLAVEIIRESKSMQRLGAPWLASLMRPDYAGTGPQVTNVQPGLSWHQYGKAVDCFVQGGDGQAIWDRNHFSYEIYAEEAARMGLTSGGNWHSFPDAVHVQATKSISPVSDGWLWPKIEELMIKNFKEKKTE